MDGPAITARHALPPAEVPERVRATARDFEAVFLGQLLRVMPLTGQMQGPFADLLVDEYAKLTARAGGIGIAPVIERELLKLQGQRE